MSCDAAIYLIVPQVQFFQVLQYVVHLSVDFLQFAASTTQHLQLLFIYRTKT